MSETRMNISKSDLLLFIKISPNALLQMKDFWVKRIQGFTRSGKSLFNNGEPLKPLSSRYIAFRQRYTGPVSQFFRPKKSNLTFTGQLLDSLKGSANVKRQTISVFPTGTRSDGKTNKEVAENVADNGRPFLGLDDKGRERLIQIAIRDLRRTLKRRRKK